MSKQDRLLDVASAIASGSDVNWDDIERGTQDDRERSVVRELRLLSNIAEAARDPSSKQTGPHAKRSHAVVIPPETWGHLRVLNQIGHGSFGDVYRAWDSRLERDVALKLARPSRRSTPFDLSRAVKEARLLARVRHHNVVTVYDADCHDDRFGLWMELITGRTLEEFVAAHGTMSAREASAIGVDLCHALAAVHRARLLHRDVKASNVMREDGGRIVLMDFGTGRGIPAPDELVDPLAGTPVYLAPELLAKQKPSVASDIYSLGVLLYHLVTRGYPVTGVDRDEVAHAHTVSQRASLRDARPDLPPAFVDAVGRALSPNPAHRYKTAGEFGVALALQAGVPYDPDPRPTLDWRLVAAGVAAVAVAAITAVTIPDGPASAPDSVASSVPAAASQPSEPTAPVPVTPAAYEVMAAFYAVRNGRSVRLTPGSRVAPGDQLFLTLEASRPVFVYVVNQDDAGDAFLLAPLPGYEPQNPVPPGATNRLPGFRNGEAHHWEVTSAGGREHFLVYVATERLTEFEQMLAALPRAEAGRPVESVPLSPDAVGILRGVGGVARADKPPAMSKIPGAFELKPLPDGRDAATGIWARRITFDNPVSKR